MDCFLYDILYISNVQLLIFVWSRNHSLTISWTSHNMYIKMYVQRFIENLKNEEGPVKRKTFGVKQFWAEQEHRAGLCVYIYLCVCLCVAGWMLNTHIVTAQHWSCWKRFSSSRCTYKAFHFLLTAPKPSSNKKISVHFPVCHKSLLYRTVKEWNKCIYRT